MAAYTGVFPVFKNQFKVGASKEAVTTIADMESFSVSFSNGVETWTPMDTEGWQRALMTAKAVTISLKGKRNIGDTGNDFVAGLAFKSGQDAQGVLVWTFPDGGTVTLENAVFDVKNLSGADSTNVGPLEFDVISNGKPDVKAVPGG